MICIFKARVQNAFKDFKMHIWNLSQTS